MTVTGQWLESLTKKPEAESLKEIRAKSRALFHAKHGREATTDAEKREGMQLLETAAEAVKNGSRNGNGGEGRPPTRAEMREIWRQEDAAISRSRPGW